MRKNGSKLISLRQYRLTDLFLFAAILVGFELIVHYAFIAFRGEFTFSPMVPIVLLVMMRWGWPSVFYAVVDGALYCLLNGFSAQTYCAYIVGNACIMLMLLPFKFIGKEKIRSKWYLSALTVVVGWVLVILGRTTVATCFGVPFQDALVWQILDCFSLVIGVVIILIMRKLDGMFEDQKHYLKRLDEERKEKARRDAYGDEPIDIDEESLAALRKEDDELY